MIVIDSACLGGVSAPTCDFVSNARNLVGHSAVFDSIFFGYGPFFLSISFIQLFITFSAYRVISLMCSYSAFVLMLLCTWSAAAGLRRPGKSGVVNTELLG